MSICLSCDKYKRYLINEDFLKNLEFIVSIYYKSSLY